jgi:hypothetical protein
MPGGENAEPAVPEDVVQFAVIEKIIREWFDGKVPNRDIIDCASNVSEALDRRRYAREHPEETELPPFVARHIAGDSLAPQ